MTAASSVAEAVTQFGTTFSGQFLRQGEPGYDDRLRTLKAKYDPDNFFHVNLNVRPR